MVKLSKMDDEEEEDQERQSLESDSADDVTARNDAKIHREDTSDANRSHSKTNFDDLYTNRFVVPAPDIKDEDRHKLQSSGSISNEQWRNFFRKSRVLLSDIKTLNTLEAVYMMHERNEDVQMVIATMLHEVFEANGVDGDFGTEKLFELTKSEESAVDSLHTSEADASVRSMNRDFRNLLIRVGDKLRRRRGESMRRPRVAGPRCIPCDD